MIRKLLIVALLGTAVSIPVGAAVASATTCVDGSVTPSTGAGVCSNHGGVATSGGSAAPATDLNCSDFATQADAQAMLEADPSDPNGLDANHNGLACEDLPTASTPRPTAGPPTITVPLYEGVNTDPHLDSQQRATVGAQVRWLHGRLNIILPRIKWSGGKLRADGRFDSATTGAVKFFKTWANQSRSLLHMSPLFPTIDGRVGPTTGSIIALVGGYFEHHPPVTSPPPTRPPVTPPPVTRPPPTSPCDPNYSGCVPIASDVDCAGGSGNGPAYVQGPIQVIGQDIYGLDNNHNGIACE